MKKVIALVLFLMAMLFTGCSKHQVEEVVIDYGTYSQPVEGFACANGSAVIISSEGNSITVKSPGPAWQITDVWLIEDKDLLVYKALSRGGSGLLHISNTTQTDVKDTIDVYEVFAVRSDGVVFIEYTDGNCQLCRYSFSDGKLSKWNVSSLSYPKDIIFAKNTLSCMYVSGGQLYALPHDSQEAVSLGIYEDDAVNLFTHVNDNGSLFLWKGEADRLFMYAGEKRTTIGTAIHDLDVETTSDGKLTAIAGDELHIYRKGEKLQTLPLRSDVFFTDQGPLRKSTVKDANTLYVLNEGNLYAIDERGRYEVIYRNISQIYIEGERIVFLENNRLNFATIKQGEISDLLQVDTGIEAFKTVDSKAVFYKETGSESAPTALYYVDFEKAIPQLITENAYGDYVMCDTPGWVFYISDEKEHPQIKKTHTVKLYNTAQSILVAEECDVGFLPRIYQEQMKPTAFYYFKLTLENEEYPWDLYRWNGTNGELVATQVKRNVYFHGTGFHG